MSREVLAVRYATREATRAEVFHDVAAGGEADGPIGMDYYFYVLREPGGEAIVVDSGFDPAVGARMGRTLLVEPGAALARLGVDAGAVASVVVTHLHYDHIGNLGLFPNAELVVAAAELEHWAGPAATQDPLVIPTEVAVVAEARAAGRVRLVVDELEVAPGVRVVWVGGHAPGQLVVVVDTDGGGVVLASDAVHYYEELEGGPPFIVFHDLAAVHAAYAVVRELSLDGARVLVAGHDPHVAQRFGPAVGPDGAFLVIAGPRADASRAFTGPSPRRPTTSNEGPT